MIDYFRIDGIDFHDYAGLRGDRAVVSIDGLVGLPAPRVASRSKTERHGASSRARWLNERSIAVVGEVWGDDMPGAYSEHRILSSVLYRTLSEGPKLATWREGNGGLAFQQKVFLSGAMGAPLEEGAALLKYSCQLQADDPRAYSQALRSVVGGALTSGGGGLTFPFRFPLPFLQSAGGVAANIINAGNVETPPVVRIYGPITSPRYFLVSSGEQVKIDGEIATGDYLEVDHGARTVKLNGTTKRMNLFNAAESTLFDIPGQPEGQAVVPQSVRLVATTFGAGAHIEVDTRDAYAA